MILRAATALGPMPTASARERRQFFVLSFRSCRQASAISQIVMAEPRTKQLVAPTAFRTR
jgi:uncharacterized protein YbaA (DUF1428 family)